ncbi:MAG: orotate phosphoribosyltransferase [Candidatus Marinimicrobia bacterium]|nr:orotate phosphoribosyltransferase [Candidatus Neomarinimicrobiota bacterium]
MIEKDVENIFRDCGALMSGHFLLSSGLHSDSYLEKFRIFEQPKIHERLISEILSHFDTTEVKTILGPALGGVIMASEAARQLNIRAVFSEKEDSRLTLRRGFKLSSGEKVLILDDIVTTGGSVKETITIAENAGAKILGIGILADRSGGRVKFGYRHHALMNLDLPVYKPEECPMCKEKMPLIKPGSRKI